MGKKAEYEIDLCNGPMLKKMLLFVLPLIGSSILQLGFNAADVIVVGRFAGEYALAAVGSNGALIQLLTHMFVGLSTGVSVLVAHFYGAKETKKLEETIHTAMLLSVIGGCILVVVGVVSVKQILILMKSPEEVLDLAALYLQIYFAGMPAVMVYNFGSAVLQAAGDTRHPMIFLLISGILNVGLNLLFVIVFHMSVVGVGIATVTSQFVSAFLVVRCLMRTKGVLNLSLRKLRIEKQILLRILKIGLPAGVNGILFSVANIMIQSSINSFGAETVASSSAAINIEGFVYMGMAAFYQAALAFVGQNMGARKYGRVSRAARTSVLCSLVIGLVACTAANLFGKFLLGLYTTNPNVVSLGMIRLRIVASFYVICGLMDVMVGIMRGLGYSLLPTCVSLLGVCVFRVVWIVAVFGQERFHTIECLYASYPISWTLTFLIHALCYVVVRGRMEKRMGISFRCS